MSEHPPKKHGPEIITFLKNNIFGSLTNQLLVEDRLGKLIKNVDISKDSGPIKNGIAALEKVGKIDKVEAALIVQYFNDYIKQNGLGIDTIDLLDEFSEKKEGEKNTEEVLVPLEDFTESGPKEKFDHLELAGEINDAVKKLKPLVRKKIKKVLEGIAKGERISNFAGLLKEINGDLDEKNKNLIVQIFDKYMKTHEVVLVEKKAKAPKKTKAPKEKKEKANKKTELNPVINTEEDSDVLISETGIVEKVSTVSKGKGIKINDLSALGSAVGLEEKGEDADEEILDPKISKKKNLDLELEALKDLGWTKKDIKNMSLAKREGIIKRQEKNPNSDKFKDIAGDISKLGVNTDLIFKKLDGILESKTPYESFDTKVYVGDKFTDTVDNITYRVKTFIRDESKPEDLTDIEEFDYYDKKDMVVFEGPFNYETGRNFERKVSNKKFGELLESGTLVKEDKDTENQVLLSGAQKKIEELSNEIEDLNIKIKSLENSNTNDKRVAWNNFLKEREIKNDELKTLIHKENEKYIIEGDITRALERNGVSLEKGDQIIPTIEGQEFIIKHPFTKFEGKTLYIFTKYAKKSKFINKSDKLQYSETDKYYASDVTERNVTEREYLGIMLQMVENEKAELQILKDEINRRGLKID